MYITIGIAFLVAIAFVWCFESDINRKNNPQCPLAKRIIYALSHNPINSWNIDLSQCNDYVTTISNPNFEIPEFRIEARRFSRYDVTASLPSNISCLIDNAIDRDTVNTLINSQIKLVSENFRQKERSKFLKP